MKKFSRVCAVALMSLVCQFGNAQQKKTEHTLLLGDRKPAEAELSRLSWLAGSWQGTGLGGESDEYWSAPRNGSMIGMFRLHRGGQLLFSEFMTIQQVGDSLVARVRHFNPDFTGWEEKDRSVDFRLVKIEGKRAWFDGLTYELKENQELNIYVAMKRKDGSFDEGHFVYKPLVNHNPAAGSHK